MSSAPGKKVPGSPTTILLTVNSWESAAPSFSWISAETTAKAFFMECVPHTPSLMRVVIFLVKL